MIATGARNVLFIMIDDLRPTVGAYGDPLAKTPNIDSIAREGIVFERAYVQQALCNPSRTSLLTGLRPETTGVHDLKSDFRVARPDAITLPQLFKQAGFQTIALGKVHHGKGRLDDQPSWSEPPWWPKRGDFLHYGTSEGRRIFEQSKRDSSDRRGLAYEAPEVDDAALVDGAILQRALGVLDELGDAPFFLAVGFQKPHLPFVAPKKYWELYPPAHVSLPELRSSPIDAPVFATKRSAELRSFHDIPATGPVSDAQAIELIRGYYACASYVDALVGRLVTKMKQKGLWENTVVIVWGDHGFHLGEFGIWGKNTNFEEATRAPFIMKVPGLETAGRTARGLIEFVDVYPSLAELFGLEPPGDLEGTSFVPLLHHPEQRFREAAFSQSLWHHPGQAVNWMGTSLRSERYRLTRWQAEGNEVELELYDYEADPLGGRNVASDPRFAAIRDSLLAKLEAGWRALPQPR